MKNLPNDPGELRIFAAALLERVGNLERLLKLAKDAQYGRSSETLSPDQLQLALEDIDQAVAETFAQEEKGDDAAQERRTRERRANRGQLPKHLPRVINTLMPEQTQCPCCAGALIEIGADESERLDVVPAQFQVIVTRRPKLDCHACVGVVVQSPAPERLIKGGLPSEALVAHVIDAKYHWRLPLYRQAQMMATWHSYRPLDAGFLDRICSARIAPALSAVARASFTINQALCRRNDDAGS